MTGWPWRWRRRASASTRGAIWRGWLCSSAGIRCTSTFHPRASTTRRISVDSAPHAMTAGQAVLAGEGELIDETVVEVASIGKFDILHLLHQGHGAGALPHAQ